MAYKIKVNRRFDINVAKTYEYLVREWGFKVADEFYEKIEVKLDQLQHQPHAGAPSKNRKNIRSILAGRHNRIYYRVEADSITILNLLDTRIDPKRNPYL